MLSASTRRSSACRLRPADSARRRPVRSGSWRRCRSPIPRQLGPAISLERLAPERLVVLPCDTNPAFHGAVVATCRDAGLSPTFVEVAEPRVEHALLAVASGGRDMALLPESAADHHVAPGVRFVPLEAADSTFESVVMTRPDTESLGTVGFLRALGRAAKPTAAAPARPAISLAA